MIENKMKLSFVPWIKKKKKSDYQTSIGVDGVLWYSYYVKCENFGLINDPLNFGFFLKKKKLGFVTFRLLLANKKLSFGWS